MKVLKKKENGNRKKFQHILENSIQIQDGNTIGWFYPNESESRNKHLCEILGNEYNLNFDNYNMLINQDVKRNIFYIHYGKIWSFFYKENDWDYNKVQLFTQEKLEQHLKRKGITTLQNSYMQIEKLEQHLKRKGITTWSQYIENNLALEQHLKRKGITTKTVFAFRWAESEQHLKRKGITTTFNVSATLISLKQHLK